MKKLKLTARPPVPPTDTGNTLMDIHDRFMNLFTMFRAKVCEECNYSVPTYYRKVKGKEKSISNAEREKIKDVEKGCIRHLMQCAGMFRGTSPGEAA